MQTRIKTNEEVAAMREGGRMLAEIYRQIPAVVKPGVTGKDIGRFAARELKAMGADPSFLGYRGFPNVICISVNDEVVHGIPTDIPFEDGDLVSFDFGVTYKGLITDSAFSMFVGKAPNKKAQQLMETTNASLQAGIEAVKTGATVGDIGAAVQKVLESGNYGIVRELVGHGVGHQVHETPDIPNYGQARTGARLQTGMTIAIEPMATLGKRQILLDSNEWTVRTRDGSLAAHAEHTVLVTEGGAEILTSL